MQDRHISRTAGILYLTIIALGLTAEVAVRQPLLSATGALDGWAIPLRFAVAADAVMVAADIALAYLLWRLLAPAGRDLAAMAALFRLAQAAVIAAHLSTQYEAGLLIESGQYVLARHALHLHAAGYDFGLIFFGINSVLTGLLLIRSVDFPAWLGTLLGAAGLVYLTGSGLRLLAPGLVDGFAPAYLVAVVAETAFAVVLLRGKPSARRPLRSQLVWGPGHGPRAFSASETFTGRFGPQSASAENGGR